MKFGPLSIEDTPEKKSPRQEKGKENEEIRCVPN